MITILVNGDSHTVSENDTLLVLLNTLHLPTHGVAVAVNRAIISASLYDQHLLQAGDQIEIIRAVGGG